MIFSTQTLHALKYVVLKLCELMLICTKKKVKNVHVFRYGHLIWTQNIHIMI
jgi:hypothetical protein